MDDDKSFDELPPVITKLEFPGLYEARSPDKDPHDITPKDDSTWVEMLRHLDTKREAQPGMAVEAFVRDCLHQRPDSESFNGLVKGINGALQARMKRKHAA